jgi:outer membrane protein assembly factor BamA
VLALRAALGAVDGSLPDLLSVGGVSSGAVEVGFGQTLGTFRTFPVRGYPANALHGRRAATLTAEYRVPLALVGESFGHLPFGTDKVALAFFGDLGDAWAPGEPPHLDRLRSVGGELVGDMTVSYDLPLRVRLGVAQPAAAHPQVYLAFAADF